MLMLTVAGTEWWDVLLGEIVRHWGQVSSVFSTLFGCSVLCKTTCFKGFHQYQLTTNNNVELVLSELPLRVECKSQKAEDEQKATSEGSGFREICELKHFRFQPVGMSIWLYKCCYQCRRGGGGGGVCWGCVSTPHWAADYYFCKILLMPTQLILHIYVSKHKTLCCTYSRCVIMMLKSTEAVYYSFQLFGGVVKNFAHVRALTVKHPPFRDSCIRPYSVYRSRKSPFLFFKISFF